MTEVTVTCFSGDWPTCRDSTTLVWIEELLVLVVVVVVLELVSFDRINFANRPKRSKRGELFEDDVGEDGTDKGLVDFIAGEIGREGSVATAPFI